MDRAVVNGSRSLGRIAVLALALAVACGDDSNETSVDLVRGQTRAVELTVTASQAFGGELLACEFVSLRPNDDDNERALENMDIELDSAGKSGSMTCTARVTVTVDLDALPGEYRIDLGFTYTYTDGLSLLTGEDLGTIRITIGP